MRRKRYKTAQIEIKIYIYKGCEIQKHDKSR